ncbi:MAG: hypothetical protein JWN64_549 [Parcubacteria group bacterium]|nr:hypothetical protein [Parcubacteria group bacterium]
MKKKYRIGGTAAGFMIGTAILFDAIQFLLTLTVIGSLVTFLVTILATIVFALWFALLGESIFKQNAAKKALISMASVITELVPVIDALPAITLGVVALIAQSRSEDRKGKGAEMDPIKARAAARMAQRLLAKSNAMEAGRIARQAQQMRRPSETSEEES